MRILTAYCTDVGTVKDINQDALLIKTAVWNEMETALLCICDGMGGLSMGERASAHVIYRFSRWFEERLPEILSGEQWEDSIRIQWVELLEEANRALAEFGVSQKIHLGTTCTAMLILGEVYYIIHIGDSRVYEITEEIAQLTNDQTVLAREIALGRVSPQEAENDARGSVLLQCVGDSKHIDPQFLKGTVSENAVYLLCSDGFRHKVTEEEFRKGFAPQELQNENMMEQKCSYFTELNKIRAERDNITVVLAKIEQAGDIC